WSLTVAAPSSRDMSPTKPCRRGESSHRHTRSTRSRDRDVMATVAPRRSRPDATLSPATPAPPATTNSFPFSDMPQGWHSPLVPRAAGCGAPYRKAEPPVPTPRAVRAFGRRMRHDARVTPETSSSPAAPVGRVLGTADATPLQFWTAVDPGSYLQLDDVVVTERRLPDGRRVSIAGVVTAVRARHEGAQFDSDVFAIADGMLPAQVQEAAEITTTRVDPEVYVPPTPGAVVHRAAGEQRAAALSFDRMQRRIPIGTGRDGAPVYLNADFLDGTRGAHVSISGVSGVATKTSFATFLLYSVFHSGALGADGVNAKALIFNVKGEDLLFLDHPNSRLEQGTVATYENLGLPAGPFADVHVHAPPRPGDPSG